jgi:aldose 1-epimerase
VGGTFSLSDGIVEAVVRPDLGAGLARFDYVARGKREALFRPEPEGGATQPFELANIILVPWSNRVSTGGFSFGGKRYVLEPNLPGEPFPIHGNGFSEAWEVTGRSATSAAITLDSVGPGPYRYAATLTVAVAAGGLTMSLSVENRGNESLPFGLGFHPWLPRTPTTLLRAAADAVWEEQEDHLPAGDHPVALPPEWDFRTAKSLPRGFINNGFVGWEGRALVTWPERALQLQIEALSPLTTYIVYSPSATADFFCFEPVSHPVDAVNLPGGPVASGLVVLATGERMSATASFTGREWNGDASASCGASTGCPRQERGG